MVDLKELNFGFARAETERTESPELLSARYFDELGLIDSALNGPTFLFLGHKGAGKSALVNHLDLVNEGLYDRFSTIYQLEDFSFTNFSKIIRGDVEPEAKFPDAWAWIILIISLESISQDAGLTHSDPVALAEAVNSLKAMGLMPSNSLRHIVNLTSRKSFKLKIPYIFERNEDFAPIDKATDIPMFVHNLRLLIAGCRTKSKHIIMLDGLDDILTSRSVQYKSLGALIFEVDRINDFFKQNGVNIKVIVVCRTDLYERIQGANKNKIKQDKSKYIDWYNNPRNPERSLLFEMLNKKASKNKIDVMREFFNFKVQGQSAEKFLLELTRHTPRDFLMLMKKISDVHRQNEKVTPNLVLSGARLYSNDYFIGEIEDELDGYTKSLSPKDWIEFLGSFGRRRVAISDLETKALALKYSLSELHEVLGALFECSAIGTVVNSGSGEHYTFKYRNRNSRFVLGNDISLHKGLWKSLNIP